MEKQIQALIDRLAEVQDEQLSELEVIIADRAREAGEAKDVETLRAYTAALETVRAEKAKRDEEAAARDAEIATLMETVEPKAETEPETELETEEPPAEPAPAEATAETPEEPAAETPEQIAASAETPKKPPLPSVAELARHRPEKSKPQPTGTSVIVASGDVSGFSAGQEISREDVYGALYKKWQSIRKGSKGQEKFVVATVKADYPQDRILASGDASGNRAKLEAVISPEALTASGGFCAPSTVRYSFDGVGTNARPIRDALPSFGADRGAVQVFRTPGLSAATGAVGIHTNTDDINGATKSVLTVQCPSPVEVTLQAVTRILQFGNSMQRAFPELVAEYVRLAEIAWAQLAENTLWDAMCTYAAAATSGQGLGAVRDMLAVIARGAAATRSRNRMDDNAGITVIVPSWLPDLLRADLVRQAPGDNTYGVSNAQIAGWLANHNIRTVFSPDGGGQVFSAQGDGAPLNQWPSTVEFLMYPEGSFVYMDGGELDLGVVRDSTLNATNDFQMFYESWENVAFTGPEAMCITADVCPDGTTAGPNTSFDPCTTGS